MSFFICRDCFESHIKIYPETDPDATQMALCGKAEAEARGRDPFEFDKLTFFKCMLMLSSDFVYTKRLEDELPSISNDNMRSHTVITSKNYPGNYPTNYYEQWVIEADDETEEYVIELSFYSFNLEDDSNCYYDWVEVSYGSYSERFCGYIRQERLPTFVTTEKSMTIKMNSNSLYTYSGFYARKKFTKKSDFPACECGKEGNSTTADASNDRIIGGAEISHVSRETLR